MSDKVQTAIKWLQWIVQAIGVILALLGGGQAVAVKLAPEAYGSAENVSTAGENTLLGIALAFVTPLVAKVVSAVWAWKRGKRATPVLDYAFALGCVANLREYLTAVPASTAPLDSLKALVVQVEADRVDPMPEAK
jgi:hypothetical protein